MSNQIALIPRSDQQKGFNSNSDLLTSRTAIRRVVFENKNNNSLVVNKHMNVHEYEFLKSLVMKFIPPK